MSLAHDAIGNYLKQGGDKELAALVRKGLRKFQKQDSDPRMTALFLKQYLPDSDGISTITSFVILRSYLDGDIDIAFGPNDQALFRKLALTEKL